MNLNNEILAKINSFILEGNIDKELEITITEENIPLKDILKKHTKIQLVYDNTEYCNICKKFMVKGEYKRITINCGHTFHKKCFDKIIKYSDNFNCVVCEKYIF